MSADARSQEQYNFSGHETFPLRYTWLPKTLQHLSAEPRLFAREDAMVILGVGKNMVAAMRYWAQAFGLIAPKVRGGLDEATDLGRKLLGPQGWDSYLEDFGTIWLLHWQIASRSSKTSTWFLAFSQLGRDAFTRAELTDWLLKLVAPLNHVRATEGSMKRDVDVFIRTYVPSTQRAGKLGEESFDSPLVELGLIQESRGSYRFVRSTQPTLPDGIFIYALLDYWNGQAAEQQTVGFETLLYGRGSPGAVFKLTENALAERLEHLPKETGFRFDDTAGMRQVLKTSTMTDTLAWLERYYASVGSTQ